MFKLTVIRNQLKYQGNMYKQRWRRIWMKPQIADLRYKASRASDIDLKNCIAKVNEKAHIQEKERKHIHIQGRTDKKGQLTVTATVTVAFSSRRKRPWRFD
jgi:hypothetical protein